MARLKELKYLSNLMSKIGAKMSETTFKPGETVWSESLQTRVTIRVLGTMAAFCLDEQGEGILLSLSDLRPIDWDIDTIMEREG